MFVATTPSNAEGKHYTIRKVADQLVCDCSDHLYRSHGEKYVCKHIAQVVADIAEFVSMATASKSASKILGV